MLTYAAYAFPVRLLPQRVPTVFDPGVKGQIPMESLFGCEREADRLFLGSTTAGIFIPRGR